MIKYFKEQLLTKVNWADTGPLKIVKNIQTRSILKLPKHFGPNLMGFCLCVKVSKLLTAIKEE